MYNLKEKSGEWEKKTRVKTIQLAIWAGLWVVTFAVAAFGPELLWGENNLINIPVILLNLGTGIGMIFANIKHLENLDELMQKVQLEAMGISLGVAIVGGISFVLLDATNVILFDAEIGGLVLLISISYLISVFVNIRRYK